MFRYSIARMIVLLLYFTLCSACGKPAPQPDSGTADTGETGSRASDINYLGGQTIGGDTEAKPEEYRSPMMSGDPPPTRLNWAPSVGVAVRSAEQQNKYKIIVWFTSKDCIDCMTIEQEIFKDSEVLANSKNWIFVRMDCDNDPDQCNYYLAGASPPAFAFLDQRGQKYRQHIGMLTTEEFVYMLKTWW
ncbi:MAG TPA: thioredoxin family protein [Firmicutes bacterium]|nr:thioredoxin family protein [Bacillota bacterium]